MLGILLELSAGIVVPALVGMLGGVLALVFADVDGVLEPGSLACTSLFSSRA